MQSPDILQQFQTYQQQYVVFQMWKELQELRAHQQHFNQHMLKIFALQESEARAVAYALKEIKNGVVVLKDRMDMIAENMDKLQQLHPFTHFHVGFVKNRVEEN